MGRGLSLCVMNLTAPTLASSPLAFTRKYSLIYKYNFIFYKPRKKNRWNRLRDYERFKNFTPANSIDTMKNTTEHFYFLLFF